MSKYRKKPVIIEARYFQPHRRIDAQAIAEWCSGRLVDAGLEIPTLEGVMLASPGDYVIRGVQGEFYPCKSDIFAATYERVADESDADFMSEVRGDEVA